MEDELFSLVEGSLKDLLNNILSTQEHDETLNSTLEELILSTGDTQTSAIKLESDILQHHGVSPLLATARTISGNVATAIKLLEDVLMASMAGDLTTSFENGCLLYQKSADVS